jgi:long-subunit fatty acid transport protein
VLILFPRFRRVAVRAVLAPCLLALPSAARAQVDQDALDPRGLANFEVGSGARAYGMAGAFLARADDATAASWNPAGLSYLRRPEVSLVGRYGSFRANSTDTSDVLVERRRASATTPDFLAATYPVSLGRLSGSVQLSFQRVFTFGGTRTVERVDTLRTIESEGGFDVAAFGAGFRVFRALRVGATVNHWYNGYEQFLVRDPLVGRTRGRSEQYSEYGISGWNANVGLIFTPVEDLNIGVVAKTPFTASVSLDRSRTDFDANNPVLFGQNAWAAADLEIDMPAALGVGASIRPQSQLTISADYTRTYWSGARIRNFFTIAPNPNGVTEPAPPQETGRVYATLPYPRIDDTPRVRQRDTEQLRFGVEYVILTDAVRYPLRAGFLSDSQPGSIVGGDAPRFNGVTFGAGAVVGPLMFDAAFLYQWADYVEASLERVTFHNRRVLVSLIYRHGN